MQTAGPVIVASKADPASLNIAQNIIDDYAFSRLESAKGQPLFKKGDLSLVIVEKECIYTEPDDVPLQGSCVIFVSRHRSAIAKPALTVHTTGNLTREAEFGGKPEEISLVEPFRIRLALSTLIQETRSTGLNIDTTMEATHHGPTSFPVPVCFVEIGSTPEKWSDSILGGIVAKAVMESANPTQPQVIPAVGFGGTHYSAKHTKICVEGEYAIGHLVSRHAFEAGVSKLMILDTFKKTSGGSTTAVVDWKGMKGEHRHRLLEILHDSNIEVVRT